ncbi:type II toxin-antitoxin system death-on-curing family toxin [Aquipuribacter nitratireducens]|uniref:Type II toxin-antitoxin system death-on-curing family toxin n=1 Tax=Aquipuribacter nitratireducens TaxID=650104 RepID=A0ABW0GLV9_9MICO
MEHLDVEDLVRLVRVLGAGPVRDLGLLDAATNRSRASAFGQDAYPDLGTKAAALLHSVVSSHPLVDGNTRLGWLACVVLLDLNGRRPDLGDDEAFELLMCVADGRLDDVTDIAGRLRTVPA